MITLSFRAILIDISSGWLSLRASDSESRNLKNKNTNKQNKDIMERNIYETPQIQVVEVVAEGVLCESGSFEQWDEKDFEWSKQTESFGW